MSPAATAFAAAKFAGKTKTRSATKRQQRIEARKKKIEKIHADLDQAKGVVEKCVLGALAKREKLLVGLDGKRKFSE